MKIISGSLSGRRIKSPKGKITRPTSSRAKESLFNFLTHGLNLNFNQSQVLDLFAGSGALGIESLSRGAEFCSFVDNEINSIIAIRENLANLGLERQAYVKKCDATKINFKFNDKGIVVTELSSKDEIEAIEGFNLREKKIIGDTQFCIYSLN